MRWLALALWLVILPLYAVMFITGGLAMALHRVILKLWEVM